MKKYLMKFFSIRNITVELSKSRIIFSGFLLLNLIISYPIIINNDLKANQDDYLDSNYIRQKRDDVFYILGPGDGFNIEIVEVTLF